MNQIIDYLPRQQALDIGKSFIVKAPAGSGKTTLLVKRYLKLLSSVNAPEEVIAITFTRKAANELVDRVMKALTSDFITDNDQYIDEQLVSISQSAQNHDQKVGWQLARNPSRIRITTIDSLCLSLVSQMPWSAGFGAAPANVSDDVTQLYILAARQSLISALSSKTDKVHAHRVLSEFENDFTKVCENLRDMLAVRDQWNGLLPQLLSETARGQLQENWVSVSESLLIDCYGKLSAQDKHDLFELINYAVSMLRKLDIDEFSQGDLVKLIDLPTSISTKADSLSYWRVLCTFVLTKDLKLRKLLNKNTGFPTKKDGGDDAKKKTLTDLLQRFRENGLEPLFAQIVSLPESNYSDDEWQYLDSICQLLKLARLELLDLFQRQSQCDHIEIASRANLALGDTLQPTDLALRLDYSIKHLLVDEFQDTSQTQIQLIDHLTDGWQDDDARTLFLVGDPMQSIYRFRHADVGIFLKIFNLGFKNLNIIPLTLQANFRSQKNVVDWVNDAFSNIFPIHDQMQSSAVGYVKSDAIKNDVEIASGTFFHAVNRHEEANHICQLISSLAKSNRSDRIAVLVRSRSHLLDIVSQLRMSQVEFQGVKIEGLRHQACIQDMLALTKSLLHFGDKLSWLSLLRAPWCGLELPDLTNIAQAAENKTIWQAINNPIVTLSVNGARRLDRFINSLEPVLETVGKQPLHHVVARAWHALGGADAVSGSQQGHIKQYLLLLGNIQRAGLLSDWKELEALIDDLWAVNANNECHIQLMTMHSAKGLEFDAVILPALNKRPQSDHAKLLSWKEFAINGIESTLLVSAGGQKDYKKRAQFIQSYQREAQYQETRRLLYVACTRAKKQIHLYLEQRDDIKTSSKESTSLSMQAILSPVLPGYLMDQQTSNQSLSDLPTNENEETIVNQYYRLPLEYESSRKSDNITNTIKNKTDSLVEYEWAGINAQHEGTILHEIIYQVAQGVCDFDTINRNFWRSKLLGLGLDQRSLEVSDQKFSIAIRNFKEDEKAQWILNSSHQHVKNEWALTAKIENRLERIVIDRTFIDSNGIRWIIDYKTSTHEGSNLDMFLDSEKLRYRSQLEKYATIFRLSENTPIKLGLYFPLLKGWRQWDYAG